MADTKISALPAATTPLAGTEVLPIVQSSVTDKVAVSDLTAGRSVSASNIVVTGSTVPANGVYLPSANTVGIATNSGARVTVGSTGTVTVTDTTTAPILLRSTNTGSYIQYFTGTTTSRGVFGYDSTGARWINASLGSFNMTLSDAGVLTVASGLSITNGGVDATSFVPTGSTVPTNGMYLSAANTLAWSTNTNGKVFLNSTGQFSIGVAAFAGQLHVYNQTTDTQLCLERGSVGEMSIGIYTGNGAYFSTNADSFRFKVANGGSGGTGGTEVVRIASTQAVTVTGNFGRGAPVTKTADFTLAATENWVISDRGATNTVTLPAASSWTGREVHFQTYQAQTLVSASANVVPLGGGAAGTAILAATAGKWATLVSDGTNWIVLQAN